jgi:hypothetical protein
LLPVKKDTDEECPFKFRTGNKSFDGGSFAAKTIIE